MRERNDALTYRERESAMSVNYVIIELATGEYPQAIGEASFHVSPRIGEFIHFRPEVEGDDFEFEVLMVTHLPMSGSDMAGDLHVLRIGRAAEFNAVLNKRLAVRLPQD